MSIHVFNAVHTSIFILNLELSFIKLHYIWSLEQTTESQRRLGFVHLIDWKTHTVVWIISCILTKTCGLQNY